jgi:hypothetical protein
LAFYYFLAGIKKGVHVIVASYADPQKIGDSGFVEMPDQNALIPQSGKKIQAALSVMTRGSGEYEIRLGRQYLERKSFKF